MLIFELEACFIYCDFHCCTMSLINRLHFDFPLDLIIFPVSYSNENAFISNSLFCEWMWTQLLSILWVNVNTVAQYFVSQCEHSCSVFCESNCEHICLLCFRRTWCKSLKQKKNELDDDDGLEKERSSNLEVKFFSFKTFWYLVSGFNRINKIAIQGTPRMAADKADISLSRVDAYYSTCDMPLF